MAPVINIFYCGVTNIYRGQNVLKLNTYLYNENEISLYNLFKINSYRRLYDGGRKCKCRTCPK